VNTPIRVLHLIAHLGRGGSERQLALLLEHLDRTRVASVVVFCNPSANALWDSHFERIGVPVLDLSASRGLGRVRALRRAVRTHKIDLIHSWTLHLNAYAAVVARLTGSRAWGSLRGTLATPGFQGLATPVRWLCLRGVERVVANAGALANELQAVGIPSRRILTLPNAVEAPREALDRVSARRRLANGEGTGGLGDQGRQGRGPEGGVPVGGFATDMPLVGSIGNLRQVKNHGLLVEAMALVVRRLPTATAVILGQPLASEPETSRQLTEQIARLGLTERVLLLGFREDAAELLPAFDVLTLTSHSEGMPNAVLEAMAAGVPVVAVAVGGVPEVLGAAGRLVPPGDAEQLAHAILEILGDRALGKRLGAHGRGLAKSQHDPAQLAARLTAAYLEVAR
jgi:glycosyltransferase involved in cell wall biosynthesis